MTDSTGSEPEAPAPRPSITIRVSRRLAIIIAAVIVVVGAGIPTGIAVAHAVAASRTFTMHGALALTDSSDDQAITNLGSGACEGSSGYDDIAAGAPVTVYDATGAVIATGNLGSGSGDGSSGCAFDFTVSKVPAGQKFYQVEISHRGKVTESEAAMRRGPVFTLGN